MPDTATTSTLPDFTDFLLISASAVLNSGQLRYMSLFDPKAAEEINAGRLKQFNARPNEIAEAVSKLKAMGFNVINVEKFSIGIIGKKSIFESSFKVSITVGNTITATPQSGGTPSALIDTSKTCEWLNGVALEQPVIYQEISATPPKGDPTEPSLNIDEICEKLNVEPENFEDSSIQVIIFDSGFYTDHPYFNKKKKKGFRPRLTNIFLNQVRGDLYDQIRALKRDKANELIKFYRKAMNPRDDFQGHGTMVLANLLSIVPQIQVSAYKNNAYALYDINPASACAEIMEVLNNIKDTDKKYIVSCSFGSVSEFTAGLSFLQIQIMLQSNVLFLYASGNKNDDEGIKFIETQWPEVISVGGAYFDTSENLIASDYAHGYKVEKNGRKVVPDICGICGPVDFTQYFIYPTQEDRDVLQIQEGWTASRGGTSSATPQVAAACALIWEKNSDLTVAEIKEILDLTGQPITEGVTAQGVEATHLGLKLVNIKTAVDLAYMKNFDFDEKSISQVYQDLLAKKP